jgi:CheY-like chemotaxis protein
MLHRRAPENPPLVMVVDDDPEILKALVGVLRDESYETMAAMNGVEALHRLRHGPRPDLIVLDLMMPQMDGIELAERLRADAELADVPVLLFSANDRVKLHAKELGALSHVKKPVDLDLLLDLVSRAIRFSDAAPALG